MYESVRREIPEFLNDQLVYCDNLTLGKNQRSCLLLTKNLQFLEFQRKQLLRSIDLRETCLQHMEQRFKHFNGANGKWFDNQQELNNADKESSVLNDTDNKSDKRHVNEESEISFGKYVYRRFELKKLYLFIKCWDKLIVLERLSNDFVRICEHENVSGFKLVHGQLKYQVLVAIYFNNGRELKTNFNESAQTANDDSTHLAEQTNEKEMKQILERVRNAKTELQLHKIITNKEFYMQRNWQTFGSNFVRSWKLEEKQMLARCGDIWLRFTHSDMLVIGVPLINTVSPPNIKMLKNLRPLLNTNSENNELQVEENGLSFNYSYQLFTLKQTFDTLESVESFFQCEDIKLQTQTWTAETTNTMLPDATAVMLIKINAIQIIAFKKCPLLLSYEVEKETETFHQQIFLKVLDFDEILKERQLYELTFKAVTLHQDFLAIAVCNQETCLHIQFASREDMIKFEQLLVTKFNFKLLERQFQSQDCNAMDIEESDEPSVDARTQLILYNEVPHSMWYGLLLLRATPIGDDADDEANLKVTWKLYTPNNEKLYMLLKILFNDLLALKCNIINIECPMHARNKQDRLSIIQFEHSLRMELQQLMKIINKKRSETDSDMESDVLQLMELQFRSDLLALKLQ